MEPSDWIIVGVLGALIVLGGFVQGYATFLSPPENPKVYMHHTMQAALDEAAERIHRQDSFLYTAFMQLEGDPTMELTRTLARHLKQLDGGARFRGPDGDYIMDEMERDTGSRFLTKSVDDARRIARETGVEAVLYGRGVAEEDEDRCRVAFALQLFKADRGEPYPEQVLPPLDVERVLNKSPLSLQYYRLRLSETSVLFRVILWFLFCAGLPFVLFPLELRMFELQSNAASIGLLIGLTAVAFFVTLLLNGFAWSGIWAILYLFTLAALAGYYYAVLDALEESG